MTTENRFFYDRLRTPPADALKVIGGGRLKGKSDISPQWRWERMTEVFGPAGIGWKWEIVERWESHGAHDEVMAFVRGKLEVLVDGAWSAPIYGMGGSMLVEAEKDGLYNNDEAWKMAETDAIGNACKYLGLAADVYRGMMDGSKYSPPPRPAAPGPTSRPVGTATPAKLCPKCGGAMWDNTRDPTPNYKCKSCNHRVIVSPAGLDTSAADQPVPAS